MNEFPPSPLLGPLLESGVVRYGSSSISRQFEEYLQRYPWAGEGLRWKALENVIQVDAQPLNDEELQKFFEATTLSQHTLVAVVKHPDERCILAKFTDLSLYFEELIDPPFVCYFVGLSDDGQQIMFDDFVEYRMSTILQLTGFDLRKKLEKQPSSD